jgi:nitroreductase
LDAMSLLHNRNSTATLSDPAPNDKQLNAMFKAAVRAPDHGWLRPWRFLTIQGDSRHQLGTVFANAAIKRAAQQQQPAPAVAKLEKLALKPLRAPLIVTVIAQTRPQVKVPVVEQLISAGCAAHSILLAAHALGFGAIWRTGSNSYCPHVKTDLGLSEQEEIVGFLYIGTASSGYKAIPELIVEDFCRPWTA